jgi:hypothetical protein
MVGGPFFSLSLGLEIGIFLKHYFVRWTNLAYVLALGVFFFPMLALFIYLKHKYDHRNPSHFNFFFF